MPHPSRHSVLPTTVALTTALCVPLATATPAYAETDPDHQLDVPAAAVEVPVPDDDPLSRLHAMPREGSAVELARGAAPHGGSGARTFDADSTTGTGGISGWAWALSTDGFTVGMGSVEVTAFLVDPVTGDLSAAGSAVSKAGGSYLIEELAAGSYVVLFAPPPPSDQFYLPEFWEDAPLAEWATRVDVADGATTPNVNERLEPLLAGYLAGENRYETSVAISSAGFDTGVDCVYIASGANFPDALSAGPAASACGGPLLLVPPTHVPGVVAEELGRLKPAEIVIAGGTAAVSAAVGETLMDYAPTVRRIQGVDRYDTSRKIVEDAFGSSEAVWVATGTNFPDALSASAAAGAAGLPVLIVPGSATTLNADSASALAALSPSLIAIAGGTTVVSSGIAHHLETIAPVTRFGGADRYETSLLINRAVWDAELGSSSVYAFLTNGRKFPDALSGAPLAGLLGAPMYVVPPACTPDEMQQHVADLGVYEAFLLGYFSQIELWEPLARC